MPNPVAQLYDEYKSIDEYLRQNNQVSLLSDLGRSFRKVILLSAGSYFEHSVTGILHDFAISKSNGDARLANFLVKQAIQGRYHQLFDWGTKDNLDEPGKKANQFWALFGPDFKKEIETELKPQQNESDGDKAEREKIVASIESFLEIGHHRNILVHSNFAAFDYDHKTAEDIFKLFERAMPFLDFLREKLA